MFIGHFAVSFAAKQAAPRLSLAVLFAAAQLADLLWPLFLVLGLEQVRIEPGSTAITPLNFVSYPYSHSLVMLVVWGVVFAFALSRENGRRTFGVLFAVVLSHWFLDFVTHRPDMPLYPGGPKVGLGLWNSTPATIAVEVAMFLLGLWMYARATRARDKRGRWGFIGLGAFLIVVYFANILGPPPPSVAMIEVSASIGFAILILWSWWADRHREAILRSR